MGGIGPITRRAELEIGEAPELRLLARKWRSRGEHEDRVKYRLPESGHGNGYLGSEGRQVSIVRSLTEAST